MEELQKLPQVPDREVFDRVWKRVMGEGGEGSPLVWRTPEETAPAPGTPPQETPSVPAGETPRTDLPDREDVLILGRASKGSAGLLQEFIRGELQDAGVYTALSKRVGGVPGRQLAALAAAETRHAKRLSTAYFLLTGLRYWPEKEKLPPVSSYLDTLRRRFQEEQAGTLAYLAAVEVTTDPYLRQLFWELARQEWDHAEQIRDLVERT